MRKADGLFKLIGLCLLAGVLVAGMLFPVVGAAGVMSNQASETVEKTSSDLADIPPPLVTTVTDNSGKPIATLYSQYRLPINPDQINEAMKWALVSVEDKRFYEHHGVDWQGTLRAAVSNSTGADTQGASTLTQQYVKNYLINVVYRGDTIGQKKAQEQSIARKLKEARIAIQLETKLSKQQILAGYLNIVEFSRQIYGIGAAAHAYFDTTPEKLTVPQAALLAGLVNNPINNDPWNHPDKATARRNLVLDRMVDNKKLAKADADRFKGEPLGVVPDSPKKPPANCIGAGPEAGFFCQYVEDYLLKAGGMTRDQLYSGGYTIKSTLDERANHEAKVSAEAQVKKTQPYIANTLSLVKPGKDRHEVVALAANRDYGQNQDAGQTTYTLPAGVYNTGGAGSTFKVFTTAAAMDKGIVGIYSPIDIPDTYVSRVYTGGGNSCPQTGPPLRSRWYCVGNAGDYSRLASGATIQTALATSPNTAFVELEDRIGSTGPAIDMAHRLGLRDTMASSAAGRTPDPKAEKAELRDPQSKFYGPQGNSPGLGSFTLGVSPVSGLEMANVAATILSGGVWCPPTPIAGVTDRNGKPVAVKEAPCEQAVPEGLANTLAIGMSKDDQPGGGTSFQAANAAGWTRPLIGKTGTTQANVSAAFVGGTPQIAGAAMTFKFGGGQGGICDAGPGRVSLCPGGRDGNIFGGHAPARTWFGAVSRILEGQPEAPLPQPDPRYMGGPGR
ncbi:transglycosylase domain-containing protein [Amycolatopsis tolypomycina]|uniref:Membrane carboxypeptidase (Penicillin-binding protein) n=1 Tax=Amycolatopsis tolypomycina TaxID=208445 RepID=A0A1H5DIT3_9PSEU|nr:transglycosylase domain-containing protein [Amycolatopsis tolypomycina]SED78833.1 Membrane carboxypeptidase (penicillin-binding protein) [Amycolatopsis tolypomycina]